MTVRHTVVGKDLTVQEVVEYEDGLEETVADYYNRKAKSPYAMTPERWERICKLVPSSVRVVRQEVIAMLEEDDEDEE